MQGRQVTPEERHAFAVGGGPVRLVRRSDGREAGE
jgi:hypothetical protein